MTFTEFIEQLRPGSVIKFKDTTVIKYLKVRKILSTHCLADKGIVLGPVDFTCEWVIIPESQSYLKIDDKERWVKSSWIYLDVNFHKTGIYPNDKHIFRLHLANIVSDLVTEVINDFEEINNIEELANLSDQIVY